MRARWNRFRKRLDRRIWELDPGSLARPQAIGIWALRVLSIVLNGFVQDRCPMRASALTYITLIGLVPVLAVMCSVAKGMDADEPLRDFLLDRFAAPGASGSTPAQEVLAQVFEQVEQIQQSDWTTLGTFALLVVVVIVIRTLGKVEETFNDIWGIRRARTLPRKVSDYTSVLILVPLLVITASGIRAGMASRKGLAFLENLSDPSLLGFGTLLVAWAGFTFLYLFMPNTRVRLGSAAFAGILTALLWNTAQWGHARFQIGVASQKALYGTFASFPIFLIWLYVSWMIVLLGAEISFAYQNVRTYRKETGSASASATTRERLALWVAADAARQFEKGKSAGWDSERFHQVHRIPVRLLNEILQDLVRGRILVPIQGGSDRFLPAGPPERITARDVLDAIRGRPEGFVGRLPEPIAAFTEEVDRILKERGERVTLDRWIPRDQVS